MYLRILTNTYVLYILCISGFEYLATLYDVSSPIISEVSRQENFFPWCDCQPNALSGDSIPSHSRDCNFYLG